MRISTIIALLVCALGLAPATALGATPPQSSRLEATIAPREITLDAPFELRLRARGNPTGAPDLAPLERDFEVLGVNQVSRTTIRNGTLDRLREWRIRLLPQRAGSLEIPAISFAGAPASASAPIPIEVATGRPRGAVPHAGRSASPASNPTVFLDVSVDEPSPYVQGQVLLRVQIHSDRPLLSGSLGDPQVPGASVERIGDDRNFEAEIDGRSFQVIEREYAVFPKRSGELRIAPIAFEGRVRVPRGQARGRAPRSGRSPFLGGSVFGDLRAMMGDGFFGPRGRAVQARSEELVLDVRPRPDTADGRWWLPAESLKLSEEWDRPTETLEVGEPVTRSFIIQAFGVSHDQIPEIELPDVTGLKQYREPSANQTVSTEEGLASVKVQKIVLIPTEPGEYLLPAVELDWWDTQADRARVASLPERRIQVVGGAADPIAAAVPAVGVGGDGPDGHAMGGTPTSAGESTAGTSSPGAERSDSPPRVAVVTAALLAIGFVFAAAYARFARRARRSRQGADDSAANPSRTAAPSRRTAERALERSCASGDGAATIAALQHLGESLWPEAPPANPGAFAERLGSPELSAAVAELQRVRFARDPDSAWNGAALFTAYRAVRRNPRAQSRAVRPILPALYPARPKAG
jgi:hypothetical protein